MVNFCNSGPRAGEAVRLGLDSSGGRSSMQACAAPQPRRGNPILEWLDRRSVSMQAYLAHISRLEHRLSASNGVRNAQPQTRRRLSLALFVDFARAQGIGAGEMATLLGDAQTIADDAIGYVLAVANTESAHLQA
jgi:hypothetical protein